MSFRKHLEATRDCVGNLRLIANVCGNGLLASNPGRELPTRSLTKYSMYSRRMRRPVCKPVAANSRPPLRWLRLADASALGAFYRRLAVRIGKAKAITATACKLALLVYRVLAGKLLYQDSALPLIISSTESANSNRCAKAPSSSGLDLVDHATGEVLVNPVS